jgi:Cellulose binding domain
VEEELMFRSMLLTAVLMVIAPLAAIVAPGAASAAPAAPACPGVISITQSGFIPPSVQPGQQSTLTVVAQNCTGQTVQGQVWWFGHYVGPDGNIAQGCPVLDPFEQAYTIAPQGSYTVRALEDATPFSGCQASGLQMTMDFSVTGGSGLAAQATATLQIGATQQPPGTCHVTYSPSEWPGGFTANVTVSNPGTAAISGWTLAFTFPGDERITSAWNATVTQTGTSVSAANLNYNATIPAGGSQSFGFQGTWGTSGASPTQFSVNGTACS